MACLEAIGVVHSHVTEPRPGGWESVESEIELKPELLAATEGLEAYSHLTVVFHLHLVPAGRRTLRLVLDPSLPEQGILATRSQLRPNPIGVSSVELLAVEGHRLRVRGLDAIDGTPVLDIRPYIPYYDAIPGARVPPWARPPDG